VKTELMPNFDFDAFNHDEVPAENGESEHSEAEVSSSAADNANPVAPAPAEVVSSAESANTSTDTNHEEVDKW
jgi:hypothetical protein